MGKGAPSTPSQSEINRAERWLEITDEATAWDWLIGRRIQALREARRAETRSMDFGPRRGHSSVWGTDYRNFSQSALASRLGFSQSWLAKIEQGTRSVTVFEAHHIAEGLGADPMAILGPPTESEQAQMNVVVEGIRHVRSRKDITAAQLAAERADAQNRRRRSSLRTAREQERVDAVREVLTRPRRPGARPR